MLFTSMHRPFVVYSPDDAVGGSTPAQVEEAPKPSPVIETKAEEKKSFTQKELDFLFADRSNRAKAEATTEILKALGVENVEKAKELIAKQMQADEASKTELEKAQEEAAQNKQLAEQAVAQAEAIKAEAREQVIRAEVIRQVSTYSVNGMTFRPEAADDVWMLIDKASIKHDDKGGFTGIKEAVEKIAQDRPHWLFNSRATPISHGTPNTNSRQAQGKMNSTNNQPGKKLVTL